MKISLCGLLAVTSVAVNHGTHRITPDIAVEQSLAAEPLWQQPNEPVMRAHESKVVRTTMNAAKTLRYVTTAAGDVAPEVSGAELLAASNAAGDVAPEVSGAELPAPSIAAEVGSVELPAAPIAARSARKRHTMISKSPVPWQSIFVAGQGLDSKISPRFFNWADQMVAAMDMSDTVTWPELQHGLSTWSTGLSNPVVYVVSLPTSLARRIAFAKRFNELGLRVSDARWMPGINGSDVPKELRNPHGELAKGSEIAFNQMPGVFGCYASHLMVFRDHLKRNPNSDLLVFEDDVKFHPNFKNLWTQFTAGLPTHVWVNSSSGERHRELVARWHLGGDAFWSPPIDVGASHYQVSWVSRTWGYVVKPAALAPLLASMGSQDHSQYVRLDQELTGGTVDSFPVLAPKQPLVVGAGSSRLGDENNISQVMEAAKWTDACWYLSYLEGMPCAETVYN